MNLEKSQQSRFPGAYFDQSKADEAVNFIEALTLTKSTLSGEPEPFVLLPHWKKATKAIYGWRRPDGTRVIRKVFAFTGRKQAKTQWAAGIVCKEFFIGDQANQEIYFGATAVKQAAICYKAVAAMISIEPDLLEVCKITPSLRYIENIENGNEIQVVSADGAKQHGFNPSLVILDELHAWGPPEHELYSALTTGSKLRREPLLIMVSTAGSDPESLCGREYEYACKVRDGKIEDPTYLPVIYEVPKEADWTDKTLWPLALPLLNTGHHKLADYEEEFLQAQQRPEKQNEFRRLYLNQWTSSVTQWLPLHAWDACAGEPPSDEELKSTPCFGGLDLGSSNDFSSFSLCWRLGPRRAFIRTWAWIQQHGIDERISRDGIPYGHWVERGWLRTTKQGVTVSFEEVFADVLEICRKYGVRSIAYDRWRAEYIERRAAEEHIEIIRWGQGYQSMSPAIEVFEDLVHNQSLIHEANPAMRWNIDCCQIKTDENKNKKLVKPQINQRNKHIDMAVSAVMSTGAAFLIEESDPYAQGLRVYSA